MVKRIINKQSLKFLENLNPQRIRKILNLKKEYDNNLWRKWAWSRIIETKNQGKYIACNR